MPATSPSRWRWAGGQRAATVLLGVGRARTVAPRLGDVDGVLTIELPPRSGAVVRLG